MGITDEDIQAKRKRDHEALLFAVCGLYDMGGEIPRYEQAEQIVLAAKAQREKLTPIAISKEDLLELLSALEGIVGKVKN